MLNQRPSFLKDLVIAGILFVLIMGIREKLGKYDYDVFKFAAEYDRQHGVYYNPETKKTEKIGQTSSSETPTKEVNSVDENVVVIHGFGKYDPSELTIVKNSIESFYGLKCVIGENVSPSDFYYTGNLVMAYRVLTLGNNNPDNNRHVYVTSEPLCASDENTSLISGNARLRTSTCVVSSYQMRMNGRDIPNALGHTVTHELAHNFGLDHCDNQDCLMKAHGLDTRDFCNNCKQKINF